MNPILPKVQNYFGSKAWDWKKLTNPFRPLHLEGSGKCKSEQLVPCPKSLVKRGKKKLKKKTQPTLTHHTLSTLRIKFNALTTHHILLTDLTPGPTSPPLTARPTRMELVYVTWAPGCPWRPALPCPAWPGHVGAVPRVDRLPPLTVKGGLLPLYPQREQFL